MVFLYSVGCVRDFPHADLFGRKEQVVRVRRARAALSPCLLRSLWRRPVLLGCWGCLLHCDRSMFGEPKYYLDTTHFAYWSFGGGGEVRKGVDVYEITNSCLF